jgi:hypothetical protein
MLRVPGDPLDDVADGARYGLSGLAFLVEEKFLPN